MILRLWSFAALVSAASASEVWVVPPMVKVRLHD